MNRRHCMLALAGSGLPLAGAAQQPGTDIAALLQQRLQAEGVALAAARVGPDGLQLASAARAGQAAPPAQARFEYGSITKTFVGLLLAEMVLRGELALDEPVEKALPSDLRLRDSQGAPLTWADLATHRSGLPRLPANLRPAQPADPYADYGEGELFAFIDGWRASRPRDSQWEYSNLGYGLLGHALGLRAERPFGQLLQERVLRPLGLQAEMQLSAPGQRIVDLLPGHDADGRPVPPWRFDALAGAGALVGTAAALARYAQAALGGVDSPLAPAFALALQPRAEAGGPGRRIGLAWLIGRGPAGPSQLLANHDGGTFGFSSSLWLDLQRRHAALVLANAFVPVNDLAGHLLEPRLPLRDVAAERRATQAPAATVTAAQLAPLAGRYALNAQFALEVRARDGRLFAQASGQGEFELFARATSGPRLFFARVTALEIQFDGDLADTTAAPALTLRQAGQTLRFVR
ncbi:MAG: serine hydrolase [Burkholderiaceae bacterium]|nr:serine hydrolase [Burkholderiaceae bacterium]